MQASKLQHKPRPAALHRTHPDIAAVQLHDLARNAEAHAGAGGFGGKKRNKNLFQQFGRDAGAVVFYFNKSTAFRISASPQCDSLFIVG